jgi:urea transporter
MKQYLNLKPIEELRYTFFVNDVRVGFATLLLAMIASPVVALSGLVALYCARWSSDYLGSSRELDESGIIAVNGFFFGSYMGFVYDFSILNAVLILMGGFVLPALTTAIARMAKAVRAPVLVLPFIMLVWMITLSRISPDVLALKTHVSAAVSLDGGGDWLGLLFLGGLRGFSQIVFSTNHWIGLVLLIMIGRFHIWRTLVLYAWAIAAASLGWLLRNDPNGAYLGHYGFGAVLLALFLEFKYPKPSLSTWGIGAIAYAISFLSAIEVGRILGVPAMTLSYCIAAWITDCAQSVKNVQIVREASTKPSQAVARGSSFNSGQSTSAIRY